MITVAEIEQTRAELPSAIVRTPIIRADMLSKKTDSTVLIKAESLQVTGSYKARAAFNILHRLTEEQKQRGAAISSSGNFASAFAYMGSLLDIPTVIVMMEKTSPYKVERTRQYGGEVVFCENRTEARFETLDRLEQEQGITTINTWEEPNVPLGHGTAGLEIVEQVPDLDLVLVPVSSGGLIAGVATAVKSLRPSAKVVGIQPQGSQAVYQSFHQGTICEVEEPNTICDALVAARPGAFPFEHVQHYVDDVVLVSDEQAKQAIRHLASTTKLVAEPGGAVGVAAILSEVVDVRNKTVVVLLSGGNIAQKQLGEILNE